MREEKKEEKKTKENVLGHPTSKQENGAKSMICKGNKETRLGDVREDSIAMSKYRILASQCRLPHMSVLYCCRPLQEEPQLEAKTLDETVQLPRVRTCHELDRAEAL